jgi:hypothetical protein
MRKGKRAMTDLINFIQFFSQSLLHGTRTQTPCELKMYLVQAIIGVNFATVAASTFMASNNSHRNTLLHTILQLNAEQAVIEQ